MSNNPRHLRPALTLIDDVLQYFASKKRAEKQQVHVVQIGANDGVTNDPIHSYIKNENWKAVLVEPQTYVFENELKRTYENIPDVHLENVAIGEAPGELPFYQLSFTKEKWATGLGSYVKDCLEDHIKRGYVTRKALKAGITLPENEADFIEEVKVKVDSFENIISRHQFDKVDLLCVDTEGFDYQVLKMFDFKKWNPELVLFESKNLADEDFIKAQRLLEENGYRLFWQKGNTLGVKFKIPLINQIRFKTKAFLKKV